MGLKSTQPQRLFVARKMVDIWTRNVKTKFQPDLNFVSGISIAFCGYITRLANPREAEEMGTLLLREQGNYVR